MWWSCLKMNGWDEGIHKKIKRTYFFIWTKKKLMCVLGALPHIGIRKKAYCSNEHYMGCLTFLCCVHTHIFEAHIVLWFSGVVRKGLKSWQCIWKNMLFKIFIYKKNWNVEPYHIANSNCNELHNNKELAWSAYQRICVCMRCCCVGLLVQIEG